MKSIIIIAIWSVGIYAAGVYLGAATGTFFGIEVR